MPAGRRMARRTSRRTSRRVSRRQQAMSPSAAPPAPEAPADQPPAEPQVAADPYEQLKQLGELHTQGILTDEEFAAEKAKILG